MYKIIDGKTIAENLKNDLKSEVNEMKSQGIFPCLAVIKVGNDKASAVYVRNKENACAYIGIESRTYNLEESTTEEALLYLVKELNEDASVNGILVQLPLPKGIDESLVLNAISASKDVDGFHPLNIGKLFIGEKELVSCTPAGIIELLKASDISIEGKECVVIGRSNIVGKPMSLLLLEENATVTIAHSKTKNLKEVAKRADILIVAIGKPEFITNDFVKEGAVVIDVGIHRTELNKLCGDVNFEDVKSHVSAITPVPGGVGPMTIVMLMKNCVNAARCHYAQEV
ncbi:MAG: bifunctional methylenetetrahydrofolate dehydrogenase/methenyltetrahydrofolate cyclohydrolase FolD [Eubacteriales bacterium]